MLESEFNLVGPEPKASGGKAGNGEDGDGDFMASKNRMAIQRVIPVAIVNGNGQCIGGQWDSALEGVRYNR